jgi:hypothetical protein
MGEFSWWTKHTPLILRGLGRGFNLVEKYFLPIERSL